MIQFLNIGIGGLVTGCLLALLATGYTLVYATTGVLNFAQGGFVVIGALLTYTFHVRVGLATPLAVVLAAAAVTVGAGLIHVLVVAPSLPRLSRANLLIMMGGLLIGMQGLAFVGWGADPVTIATFTTKAAIRLGHVVVPTQGLWIAGLAVVLLVGLSVFLGRTMTGKALRASATTPYSARLAGIPVARMQLGAYCASGMIGALAGSFVLPYNSLASNSVIQYSLLGLVAVTLGGLGSVYGAIAGGLFVGVANAMVTGYVSNQYSSTLTMVLLVLVLSLRPQGLLVRLRGRRADMRTNELGRIPITPRLPKRVSRPLLVLVVIVAAVLPQLGGLADEMRTINIIGIFALTAIGLDFLSGTAGQVNLGQAGFMAAGGYTSAILMVHGWPPIVALLAGVAAALFIAGVFGVLIGRLAGMYLGAVTLAFGLFAEALATALPVTGGSSGLAGVPTFSIGSFYADTDQKFFYLVWGLVLVVGIAVAVLNRTMFGRLLKSLHGDPVATSVAGFDVGRGKIVALLVSAGCASVAGTLYASYFHYFAPDMVGSLVSVNLVTMVIVGGAGTVVGPIVGAALLTELPTMSQSLALWFSVLEGVLIIVFLRFLPSGIWGVVVQGVSSVFGRRARPGQPAPIADDKPVLVGSDSGTGKETRP